MLDLNILAKEIQIFEKFKLHRQNVILTKLRREHAKFSYINYYDDDYIIHINDKEKAE